MSATSSATCAASPTTRTCPNYLRDLYQVPGVAETVDLRHIKEHYYGSHTTINPTGIVPVGPEIDYAAPHDRDALRQRPRRSRYQSGDAAAPSNTSAMRRSVAGVVSSGRRVEREEAGLGDLAVGQLRRGLAEASDQVEARHGRAGSRSG